MPASKKSFSKASKKQKKELKEKAVKWVLANTPKIDGEYPIKNLDIYLSKLSMDALARIITDMSTQNQSSDKPRRQPS